MKLIEALAEMLRKEFGLTVTTQGNDLQLFWSLYTQGSGVSFSAMLSDFGPLAKAMHEDGDLAEASMIKRLIDHHGLKLALRQQDSRYTHAYTMGAESEGPTSLSDDADEVVRVVEMAHKALNDLGVKASIAAERLLLDWFAINQDVNVRRVYTTKHFRVEVIKEPGDDEALAHALEDMSPGDALAEMRAAIANKASVSYRVRASVSVRDNPSCACGWKELSSDEFDGGVFTEDDVSALIKQTINHARTVNQSNSPALKEAA